MDEIEIDLKNEANQISPEQTLNSQNLVNLYQNVEHSSANYIRYENTLPIDGGLLPPNGPNSLHNSSSKLSMISNTPRVSSGQQTQDKNIKREKTKRRRLVVLGGILSLIAVIVFSFLIISIIMLVDSEEMSKQNKEATNKPKSNSEPSKTKTLQKTSTNTPTCSYGYIGDRCDIECGLVYTPPNVKIVGGTVAQAHSWPSNAYIVFSYRASNVYLYEYNTHVTFTYSASCGGNLIDLQTILTAAHCIPTEARFTYGSYQYSYTIRTNEYYPTLASMFTVYLGLHDKSIINNNNISPAVRVSVKNVAKHENFDETTYLNDIAILSLSVNVTLNNYIQVACLPQYESSTYPGTNNVSSWASGWGTTSFGGSSPNNLNNVQLTIYNPSYCVNVSDPSDLNWNSQICAGEFSGGKDTCQGDSGSILFIKDNVNSSLKYVAAGITSYGTSCAQPGFPGIYTRVSYYLDWISSTKSRLSQTQTPTSIQNPSSAQAEIRMNTFSLIFLTLNSLFISQFH